MRVLVLGGYGAVGARVIARLRERGVDALAAGRDPRRADVVVDARDRAAYRAALAGVDVVVNAAGIEDPPLVVATAERGAAFVDITASWPYVDAVQRIAPPPPAPVLFSVGLAPGLTNLVAADVHDGQPVDIVVVLGAGEAHGAAATDWTYERLGRTFTDFDGQRVRNFGHPRTVELPGFGRRRVYRLDFADQHAVSRGFGTHVCTYFAMDSRLATAGLAALSRVPGARRMPRGLHLPGTERWLAFARSGSRRRWAAGHNQSHATAIMTAWAVELVPTLASGVHHLHEVATLADLPEHPDIQLSD
jgi:saccharopine dehydrogenase-like NADP-dependent oxidoreductase